MEVDLERGSRREGIWIKEEGGGEGKDMNLGERVVKRKGMWILEEGIWIAEEGCWSDKNISLAGSN